MTAITELLKALLHLAMPVARGIAFGVLLAVVAAMVLTHSHVSTTTRVLVGLAGLVFAVYRVRALRAG